MAMKFGQLVVHKVALQCTNFGTCSTRSGCVIGRVQNLQKTPWDLYLLLHNYDNWGEPPGT